MQIMMKLVSVLIDLGKMSNPVLSVEQLQPVHEPVNNIQPQKHQDHVYLDEMMLDTVSVS